MKTFSNLPHYTGLVFCKSQTRSVLKHDLLEPFLPGFLFVYFFRGSIIMAHFLR